MARFLAVDWDEREVRYLLGNIQRGKLKIVDSAAAPVTVIHDEEAGTSTPDIAGSLREMLTAHRVGRCPTLIALDRRSVEIMHFELPPATDAELPEFVQLQAMRDSTTVEERTPVDFITTDENIQGENRRALVVALPEDRLKRIREIASKAGVKPYRMPLRSFSTVRLFSQCADRTDEACLLANLVGDELDLSVLVRGKPVFARTIRLPMETDDKGLADRIISEVTRTLAVVGQEQTVAGQTIERLFLFAGPDEHVELTEKLGAETPLTVTRIEPFAMVDVDPTAVPTHSGRFAALAGMLLDEAGGMAHPVDLLHPRRKPKPRSLWKPVAAVVLLVVLLGAGHYWLKQRELQGLQEQFKEVQARQNDVYKQYTSALPRRTTVARLTQWDQQGAICLDELRDMSRRLPSGRNLLLTRIAFTPNPRNPAMTMVSLRGQASNSEYIRYCNSLYARDPHHKMVMRSVGAEPDSNYPWHFSGTLLVARTPAKDYFGRLPRNVQMLNYQQTATQTATQQNTGQPQQAPATQLTPQQQRMQALQPQQQANQQATPTANAPSQSNTPQATPSTETPPSSSATSSSAPQPTTPASTAPASTAPAPAATPEATPQTPSAAPPSTTTNGTSTGTNPESRGREGRSYAGRPPKSGKPPTTTKPASAARKNKPAAAATEQLKEETS